VRQRDLSRRPNHASCVVWSTGAFPADNSDDADGAARQVATRDRGGTVFRIVEYQPGVARAQITAPNRSTRKAAWKPPIAPPLRGYAKLCMDHLLQAEQGSDFDFLRKSA
jgi:hypothetical protein